MNLLYTQVSDLGELMVNILSHSGLDRTLYIASLHSDRMEIKNCRDLKGLWGCLRHLARRNVHSAA
jgi:hypothetical protein